MDCLTLSDEQREFQELARDFAKKELAPKSYEIDQKAETPLNLLKKAWDVGLINVLVPDEFGGLALSLSECCVIGEELASGGSGVAAVIEASTLAQLAIIYAGTDSQKKRFLEPLTERFLLSGIDAQLFSGSSAAVQLSGSELTGEIAQVANADCCEWFIAVVQDAKAKAGKRLVVLPSSIEGLTILERVHTIGRQALSLRHIKLKNVKVNDDLILPDLDAREWEHITAQANCVLAAGTIGVARDAMEHAIKYSKERKTFGKPISEHQAVAFMLADMAKDIEAARLLLWQALASLKRGEMVSAIVARSFAQQMAMKVTTDAVQVYGGYGFSKEYPVEGLMRDAKTYQVYQGNVLDVRADIGSRLVHTS